MFVTLMLSVLKKIYWQHIIYEKIRKYFSNIEEMSKIQTYKEKNTTNKDSIKIKRKKKQNNKNTKTNAKHE